MKTLRYIALLRGINVGGNNIIKMTDLKSHFENMGFTDVLTYIQSGNVLFKSDEKKKTLLIRKIEQNLKDINIRNWNTATKLIELSEMS